MICLVLAFKFLNLLTCTTRPRYLWRFVQDVVYQYYTFIELVMLDFSFCITPPCTK